MANIWLLVVFATPILLLILLRVNAVFVYLGFCVGFVLSEFDGQNKTITKLAGSSKVIERLGGSTEVRLILLVLPAILILLFMIKSAKGGKFTLNLLPAIAVGVLAVITVIPLLPVNTAVNIMNGSAWKDVTKYEGTLIGLSTLVIVVMLIVEHSKFGSLSKGKGKHHKSKD